MSYFYDQIRNDEYVEQLQICLQLCLAWYRTNPFKDSRIVQYSALERGSGLGRGGFGLVCLATYQKQVMAYKIGWMREENGPTKPWLLEFYILTTLNHPHLVKLVNLIHREVDYVSTDLPPIAIQPGMELCVCDLAHVTRKVILTEKLKLIIIQHILAGLDYLHKCNIIHRDVKPENVLLGFDGLMKLCDFGMARFHDTQILTPKKGTKPFKAPEADKHKGAYTKKIDMWSLACLIFEIWSNTRLADACPRKYLQASDVYHFITRLRNSKLRRWLSNFMPDPIADLVIRMLLIKPDKRPDPESLLADPVFANLPTRLHKLVWKIQFLRKIGEDNFVFDYVDSERPMRLDDDNDE